MGTATLDLPVAGAPAIPGLRYRRFRDPSDYLTMAAVLAAASVADDSDYIVDAETLRIEYENWDDLVPSRDLVLAEVDGRLVAFGDGVRQVRDGVAVYTTSCTIHPDWRRRGLGRPMLRYLEAHLRGRSETFEDPGGRVLGAWVNDRDRGAMRLMESEGYRPVRYGFSMIRPSLEDIPLARLPDGIEVREVRPEDHRAIFEADNEAFRDHWGHREQTESDFRRLFALPDLDTGLWSVAWVGDEVVGSVQSMIWKAENETLGVRRGWLEHISVRRSWRRRGVGRAIIVDALRRLRDAGMDEAMLGVDAENPTGALRLYESLGFRVKDRGVAFRKAW